MSKVKRRTCYFCVFQSTRLDRIAGRAGAVGSAGSSGRRDVGQRRQRIPLFFPTAQRPGRPQQSSGGVA